MADDAVTEADGVDDMGGDTGGDTGGDRTRAKTATAFRTIGELSRETGLPQHVLRYWETRFPQLRPVQRAGKRRYYRPEDVSLVRRIDTLLNRDGYTIRGVQQLLKPDAPVPPSAPTFMPVPVMTLPYDALRTIRALLAGALAEDAG